MIDESKYGKDPYLQIELEYREDVEIHPQKNLWHAPWEDNQREVNDHIVF